MEQPIRVVMIGAHNDECEYGLGGVTRLLTDRGCRVKYINTSGLWHKAAGPAQEKTTWQQQENAAAQILGADKVVLGDRDRSICEDGEAVILQLERLLLEEMPDIVFLHYPRDNHLEHRISAKSAYAAICLAAVHGAHIREVYAFEAGPNQTSDYFHPDFAINVTDVMPQVRQSLMLFDQPTAKGSGLWREKEIQAQYRGHIVSFPYAECFKIVKYPNGNDDFLLRQLLREQFRWYGNGMYPANGEWYF